MMGADRHAIAQTAELQRRLKIGHTLVAVPGIVAVGANGRAVFVADRTVCVHAVIGGLLASIDDSWDAASGSVGDEFSCGDGAHAWPASLGGMRPIWWARATSFTARCTTGASIIFEPRLTTPNPFACASSKAATIFSAFSSSAGDGAKAR